MLTLFASLAYKALALSKAIAPITICRLSTAVTLVQVVNDVGPVPHSYVPESETYNFRVLDLSKAIALMFVLIIVAVLQDQVPEETVQY